jgi:hypothetical protein
MVPKVSEVPIPGISPYGQIIRTVLVPTYRCARKLREIERTDVTQHYERKQIILNVTSTALLGNPRSHEASMTSNFLTLREPGPLSSKTQQRVMGQAKTFMNCYRSILVGFDFGYGYPNAFAKGLGGRISLVWERNMGLFVSGVGRRQVKTEAVDSKLQLS